jgi:spore germination protein GerM
MNPVRATLAVALLLTVAACGIPADDSPRAISRDEEATTATDEATPTSAEGQTNPADLYFTIFTDRRGDELVVVRREVAAGGASTPSPATVLGNLLDGVADGEQAVGVDDPGNIVTKIPAETALASQPVLDEDGTLTVDLNEAINSAQGDGARLAYGQLVCTATALDEVRDVRFTVEGERVGAPTGEGDNRLEPLSCDDYTNLVRPSG